MDFTRGVKEVNVSEGEYKSFVENNITEFDDFNKYLLKVEESIEFKLFGEKSKLFSNFIFKLKSSSITINPLSYNFNISKYIFLTSSLSPSGIKLSLINIYIFSFIFSILYTGIL